MCAVTPMARKDMLSEKARDTRARGTRFHFYEVPTAVGVTETVRRMVVGSGGHV